MQFVFHELNLKSLHYLLGKINAATWSLSEAGADELHAGEVIRNPHGHVKDGRPVTGAEQRFLSHASG